MADDPLEMFNPTDYEDPRMAYLALASLIRLSERDQVQVCGQLPIVVRYFEGG